MGLQMTTGSFMVEIDTELAVLQLYTASGIMVTPFFQYQLRQWASAASVKRCELLFFLGPFSLHLHKCSNLLVYLLASCHLGLHFISFPKSPCLPTSLCLFRLIHNAFPQACLAKGCFEWRWNRLLCTLVSKIRGVFLVDKRWNQTFVPAKRYTVHVGRWLIMLLLLLRGFAGSLLKPDLFKPSTLVGERLNSTLPPIPGKSSVSSAVAFLNLCASPCRFLWQNAFAIVQAHFSHHRMFCKACLWAFCKTTSARARSSAFASTSAMFTRKKGLSNTRL